MSRLLYQGVRGVADRTAEIAGAPSFNEPASHELQVEQWDKLREECGVVAVHGHPEAARQAYLGLYALQHRGQESSVNRASNLRNWLQRAQGLGVRPA